jgi:hypothetical protein
VWVAKERPMRALYAAILLTGLCAFECAAQEMRRLSVLKACEKLFGAPIDKKANLFKINSQFVLQPKFDAGDNLMQLKVAPKYFFREMHPEWLEPNDWPLLTRQQYLKLLDRFDRLSRPRGKLVGTPPFCAVSNQTCLLLDRYENAYVNSGITGDKKYRFFDLYPFHEIEGMVVKKIKFGNVDPQGIRWVTGVNDFEGALVRVGDLNYYVKLNMYDSLEVGSNQRFPAVYLQGLCFEGSCNP